MRKGTVAPLVALALLVEAGAVYAQSGTSFNPGTPQSESTGPNDPRSTGRSSSNETTSERLEKNEGVIRPAPSIAPEIAVRPPVPNPGTTPPPPGSPGGDQTLQPK